jgi:DNA-binding response OmpR family regulator
MKPARLLVVDDAKFTRDLMVKAVKAEYRELEVDVAQDGRKAQGMLSRTRYDLVLCDWEMPEMSGIELLTWLRDQGDSKNREVAFIMVTSLGDKEYILEAAEHGVTDYITKPFNNDQLVSKVTKQFVKQGIMSRDELSKLLKRRDQMMGGGGTANVLTRKQGMNKSAPVNTPKHTPPSRVRGKAMLLFSEHKLPVYIRELTPRDTVLTLKSDQAIPDLFESVSVGLLAGQGEQQQRMSTKGKVTMLQAKEKSLDADIVYVGIQFLEQDAKKQQLLTQIIGLLSS